MKKTLKLHNLRLHAWPGNVQHAITTDGGYVRVLGIPCRSLNIGATGYGLAKLPVGIAQLLDSGFAVVVDEADAQAAGL